MGCSPAGERPDRFQVKSYKQQQKATLNFKV